MATQEQERAAFALKKVEEIDKDKAKFKTQLLKLPARLHNNGLGQTVAFYLSAGKEKPEVIICGWIEAWLQDRRIYLGGRLIDNIAGQRLPPDEAEVRYREASVEVRALAVWLKRFAEAFIEGEEEAK
ncbi:MAG: type III-B CRISPR module-associated protein Cmr5 [Acidobacteria bacterium]|nr:type III-B CRISPR module-associated protein Cmr5 [Acidobacteriota bacterium]